VYHTLDETLINCVCMCALLAQTRRAVWESTMTDKTRSILASYALKKSEAAAKEKADRAEKEAKKVKGLGLVDIRKFFTPKTPRAPTAAEIEVPADATAMSNDEILEFIADLKNVHGIVDPEAPSVRKSKFESQGMLFLCFMLCACDFVREQRIASSRSALPSSSHHYIMSSHLSLVLCRDTGDEHRVAAARAADFAAHGANKKARTCAL